MFHFHVLRALLLRLSRLSKSVVAFIVDAAICAITVWLAFCLRFDSWHMLHDSQWFVLLASWALALPVFMFFGLYRSIFRYTGWTAMTLVVRATLVYGLIFSLVFVVFGVPGVPRSVGVIQPILLLFAVGASRVFARYWLGDLRSEERERRMLPKALIYGAGAAGRQLAAALAGSREMRIVGFLDDDHHLHGHMLNGLVIHDPSTLDALVTSLGVTSVLLAIPSVSRKRRNEILNHIQTARVSLRTLPRLLDLLQGRVSASDVGELDTEDLLGREPVQPDPVLLGRNIQGKVVMVTGAGGSIGSELCRQIIRNHPTTLLLVEQSEFALYQIHQELLAKFAEEIVALDSPAKKEGEQITLVPLLASVCDARRMTEIIATWQPHTVYHAAAYKHVPLVEHNPAEGVKNNVFGTLIMARIASLHKVTDFVLVSTDKAVRPTNIMGASKRLAEIVLQVMNATKGQRMITLADEKADLAKLSDTQGTFVTRFSIVRFGNVLGSSGSVVPKFRQQIKNGGPITLTHADVTRYFMTTSEAALLVIQAGAMASDDRDIFVLDMGGAVKIKNLAYRMVNLSGLTVRDNNNPGGDIEIRIDNLRPGEKLYEELLVDGNPAPTEHPRIRKAQEDYPSLTALEEKLTVLASALERNDVLAIRRELAATVFGYAATNEVVDWVCLAQEKSRIKSS